MEISVDNGSEKPRQIQKKNDTETFTESDPNTTGKSLIGFLK